MACPVVAVVLWDERGGGTNPQNYTMMLCGRVLEKATSVFGRKKHTHYKCDYGLWGNPPLCGPGLLLQDARDSRLRFLDKRESKQNRAKEGIDPRSHFLSVR
mmetsp:Transcript_12106/g.28012  ORF Transcript_12106/g.28012 Transcript_12106/m.28012 type:complete len:102 (+) Transcript_12106:1-306(+)